MGWLKRFLVDRRANIAIITGLCAFPMFGLIGLAFDYAVSVSDKQKLDNAADAAAIAAITKARSVILANSGVTGTALTDGQAQGWKAFKANAGSINFGTVPVPTIVLKQPTPQSLMASVNYSTSVSNNFGGLFGQPTTTLNGASSSALTIGNYVNIYLVMDTSQSMGIAATPTDMANLFNATSAVPNQGGCVFGCHVLDSGQTSGLTNEQIAHSNNNNISLRIDIIKGAVQNMIGQITSLSGPVPTVSVGLYTMELGLSTIANPTTNYTSLKSLAAGIDLGTDQDGGTFADTSTQTSIAALTTIVGNSGDGSSASNPKKYVFILTDGTSDTYSTNCSSTSNHCVTPYQPSWFTQLNQNATTGIIYTQYYPIYNNNNPGAGYQSSYLELVYPIAKSNGIPTALQSCTSTPNSSNWFIQASDTASLNSALNTFLAQSLQVAQITQ